MESYMLYMWLLIGAIMIVLEAFGANGIGLFFGGLAAFCVASLIALGVIDASAYGWQLAIFFGLTFILAIALWRPVQRILKGRGEGGYNNMIGEVAILKTILVRGEVGQAIWSGTIMQAELAPDATDGELPEGARVEIVDIRGNKLIVKKRA